MLTHGKSETHSLVGKNKKFIILGYEVSSVSTVLLFIIKLEKIKINFLAFLIPLNYFLNIDDLFNIFRQ